MRPMTLQFIIVMIAAAINDRLQRKLDDVEEERCFSVSDISATCSRNSWPTIIGNGFIRGWAGS